ncbi:hypothetical protein IFM89_008614 [Coptis chinensis]|uniref:Peptidase A1 domain-containing protein n=1 Tax=Coptis chinensis TaxID=261450 RepID=A0A835HL77_9MAGN|nr:hypothetical protein IFM89_008614 [Coptis chinensis]
MVATVSATLSCILVIISLVSLSSCNTATSKPTGFTTRLIHRNSIRSPFHNPNLTKTDRIRAAVHRSSARTKYFKNKLSQIVSPKAIATPAWAEVAEYMMEYYIGKETQSIPLFDPSKSVSYVPLTSNAGEDYCKNELNYNCGEKALCQYEMTYLDGIFSKGDIATKTLSFRDNDRKAGNYTLEHVVIGCDHHNNDTTSTGEVPLGIIGLNRSPASLVRQLIYAQQFAYCFGEEKDRNAEAGYIKFEDAASLSGNSTPILTGIGDSSYFVNLEGISIGSLRLPIPNDTFTYKKELRDGGFIVDSGCTYNTAFRILTDELDKRLQRKHFKDPDGLLEVCYKGESYDFMYIDPITFHFIETTNVEYMGV